MRRSVVLVRRIRMDLVVAGVALAMVVVAGLLQAPGAAGGLPGCCICNACAIPPVTQCFESPAQGCNAQCASLLCDSASDTSTPCPGQPQCGQFSPPAPAPARAPVGLAFAALALTGLGLRALQRRH
jgi:hypothetical protein